MGDLAEFVGKKIFLAPDVLIKFLTIEKEEFFDNFIHYHDIIMLTSDFALYEALSSISKEEIRNNRLAELLFMIQVVPSPKIRITMERINHLRSVAGLKDLYSEDSKNDKKTKRIQTKK